MTKDSPQVQTKHEIESILQAAGLRPRRRLGQHFLIDGNLMRKLVNSAAIDRSDTVLEVGGGTGSLSEQIAPHAGHLVVVEIDKRLAPILEERLADYSNVAVLHTDVLDNKSTIEAGVLDHLRSHPPDGGRYKLVANLPYNVATPLLMNLLFAEPRLDTMCFTIQKEVADRLTAQAGTADFGAVSIAIQTVCRTERIAPVPTTAFWPPPKVESAMIRLTRKPHAFEQARRLRAFFDLVKLAFAHRRKTLRYNFSRSLSDDQLTRAARIVDLGRRAESVPLDEWIQLGTAVVGR